MAVREDLLPMSYYTNMTEAAMVMSSAFDFLFEIIDPQSFKALKNTPSNVFQKHFTTLFTEFCDPVAYAVLDLVFAFGSGFMRGATAQLPPSTAVNRDFPLSRTQQLLICVALAMTRQIIYESFLSKKPLTEMPMNEFEDLLSKINDVPRIVSETIQLENYIFRVQPEGSEN